MPAARHSPAELAAYLRRVAAFADLDDAALRVLARVAQIKSIPRQTYLFYQDDPGDAAFVVRLGKIAILLATPDGRELVINELGPGECFGELALLTDAPRTASALARQDSEIIRLPRDEFLDELEHQPKLMRHILEITACRLRASTERERALAFFDAPARLARVLLELDRAASDKGYITLSQDELARHVGVARQTTAKILGQWRRAGWLLTGRGRVVLLDRAALGRRAEQ
ncbi:MAG: Crp/Fnr family transcriptional regulator [Anaerolineae bacterium]|nr:Crp/Fnr family transcriptional regulator [Anaerolineae bacterium]